MNIFAKTCLLRWPDKDEVIAELDARVSARFNEGETRGTATGYFTLIKGRIPTLHEVRDTRLKMEITDRKGNTFLADVMISMTQPIEYPGTEVPVIIESIEQVEG